MTFQIKEPLSILHGIEASLSDDIVSDNEKILLSNCLYLFMTDVRDAPGISAHGFMTLNKDSAMTVSESSAIDSFSNFCPS